MFKWTFSTFVCTRMHECVCGWFELSLPIDCMREGMLVSNLVGHLQTTKLACVPCTRCDHACVRSKGKFNDREVCACVYCVLFLSFTLTMGRCVTDCHTTEKWTSCSFTNTRKSQSEECVWASKRERELRNEGSLFTKCSAWLVHPKLKNSSLFIYPYMLLLQNTQKLNICSDNPSHHLLSLHVFL